MRFAIEPHLFRRCIHEQDDESCRELARGFWDRQYLRRVGIDATLSDLGGVMDVTRGDPSPQPSRGLTSFDPTPTPMIPVSVLETLQVRLELLERHLEIHETLLADVISSASLRDGPRSRLLTNLSDSDVRLEAAETVRDRLVDSLDDLEEEIDTVTEE